MTDEPTVADVRRAYPDWTIYQGTDSAGVPGPPMRSHRYRWSLEKILPT